MQEAPGENTACINTAVRSFSSLPEIKIGKSYRIPGSSIPCEGHLPFNAITMYYKGVYRK